MTSLEGLMTIERELTMTLSRTRDILSEFVPDYQRAWLQERETHYERYVKLGNECKDLLEEMESEEISDISYTESQRKYNKKRHVIQELEERYDFLV